MEIILTNANSGNGHSVFPGDSVIKNPPASTGAMGLILDPGRSHIAKEQQTHVPQLLSLCSKPGSHNCWPHVSWLLKSVCPTTRAPEQEKPLQWAACTPHLESSPHSLQADKNPCGNKVPALPKINK